MDFYKFLDMIAPYVGYVVFGGGAVVMLYLFIKFEVMDYRNRHSPEVSVAATIESKSMDYDAIFATSFYNRSGGRMPHINLRMGDGSQLKLTTTESQYYRIEEGKQGTVTYRGTKFLNFAEE